jgi:hypothetical protein
MKFEEKKFMFINVRCYYILPQWHSTLSILFNFRKLSSQLCNIRIIQNLYNFDMGSIEKKTYNILGQLTIHR